jgi:hypothetical protein
VLAALLCWQPCCAGSPAVLTALLCWHAASLVVS